jgi:hypothetical protein
LGQHVGPFFKVQETKGFFNLEDGMACLRSFICDSIVVIFPIAASGCHVDHFSSYKQLPRSDSTSSNKELQKTSEYFYAQ